MLLYTLILTFCGLSKLSFFSQIIVNKHYKKRPQMDETFKEQTLLSYIAGG